MFGAGLEPPEPVRDLGPLLSDCTDLGILRISRQNRIGGGNLIAVIQMGVDIGGGSNITVTKPFLNVLQCNTIGIQQAGAAVAQIVKTNLFQIVLSENLGEVLGDEIGLDQASHGIHIDVIKVVFAVAVSAELLINTLLFSEMPQQNLKGFHQRQGPAAGFGFGCVLLYYQGFAFNGKLDNCMPDADSLLAALYL